MGRKANCLGLLGFTLIACTILVLCGFLLSGCASIRPGDNMSVQGVFDRALAPPIYLPQQPAPVGGGVLVSDVNVAAMDRDFDTVARLRLAQYNGQSVDAAITQAVLSTSIGAIGMAGGPVAAAGGVGLSSLLLQHIFTIINTPAKAQAYLDFIRRNQAARDEYYTARAGVCGITVPGDQLTAAGGVWLSRLDNSQGLLDSALQMSQPTLAQMQAVEASQNNNAMMQARLAALEDCPPVSGQPAPARKVQRSTLP